MHGEDTLIYKINYYERLTNNQRRRIIKSILQSDICDDGDPLITDFMKESQDSILTNLLIEKLERYYQKNAYYPHLKEWMRFISEQKKMKKLTRICKELDNCEFFDSECGKSILGKFLVSLGRMQ